MSEITVTLTTDEVEIIRQIMRGPLMNYAGHAAMGNLSDNQIKRYEVMEAAYDKFDLSSPNCEQKDGE